MWDSSNDTGERQEQWVAPRVSVIPEGDSYKVKIPLNEYIDDMVENHLDIEYPGWEVDGIRIHSEEEAFVYICVDKKTGKMTIVGCDGHPLDITKNIK